MIPAEICRAALCEAGRPDLARHIGTNRAGHPTRFWARYSAPDAALVARAFALAYHDDPQAYCEHEVRTMLLSDVGPWHESRPHWSPRLGRWCDQFNPADWR
jgi:hypothetical protein